MKRLLLVLITLSVFLLTISVGASAVKLDEYGIEIEIPTSYTVLNSQNAKENVELLKELNFNENSFKNYLSDNKILIFAVDKEGREIIVKSYETDFTKSVYDFGLLEDAALKKVGEELLTGDFDIVEKKNAVFLCEEFSSTDLGGEFSGVQYVTVCNSKLYTISLTVGGRLSNDSRSQAEKIINSFSVEESNSFSLGQFDSIITLVIISVGIVAFIAVAVYLIVFFVNLIKQRKNTSDVAPYVKIKRRKF